MYIEILYGFIILGESAQTRVPGFILIKNMKSLWEDEQFINNFKIRLNV